jgi:hypothetical protein
MPCLASVLGVQTSRLGLAYMSRLHHCMQGWGLLISEQCSVETSALVKVQFSFLRVLFQMS